MENFGRYLGSNEPVFRRSSIESEGLSGELTEIIGAVAGLNGVLSLAPGLNNRGEWMIKPQRLQEPLSKDGDRSGGGRVVGVEEEDGVLIALEAGDVVVEGDKGAVEAGHLEGASGVGGPGGGEYGGELGGIEARGGAAGGGESGVVGPATELKFVDGLEAGDGVVGGSGGWTEQ